MAATLIEQKVIPIGQSEALVFGTIAMDNSYPTGGEAIDAPGSVGYHHLLVTPSGGYVGEWDSANQKILARYQKDPANAGGANIALTEVTSTADLSAVSFPFIGLRPA